MKANTKDIFANVFLWIALLGVFLAIVNSIRMGEQVQTLPYNQFVSMLERKQLGAITIRGEFIEGELEAGAAPDKAKRFVTTKMDDPGLTQKLVASGVRFEAVSENTLGKNLFSWLFPVLLMLGIWWLLFEKVGHGVQGQFMALGKSKAKAYVEQDIKIRFADVAGVDEAKLELQEVVQFLKEPAKYNRLGGRIPKGILLVGPPGTGKTLLARAVAGEASVAFYSINGSEFVEMFIGLGAARVRDLFVEARSHAPCIIFIDELDALGKMRGVSALTGSHEEKEQTLNQLLAELDGFDTSQGIVLLAATNRPEILDPALLRSGRFDRQVVLDKPDRKGRFEILKIHVRKVHLAEEVDLDRLASLTAGFSGADLANLVNEAALIATRRDGDGVGQDDFTIGIERLVAGLERRSRILSEDEKRQVAYHEMGHAVVSFALEKTETVHKVSIIPRGIGALGYTMRRPLEDRYLISKEELENRITVLLGGRAAETVFLKQVSTGAADDFDKATDIARTMVTRYGMSEVLGLLSYDKETAPLLDQRILSRSHDYSEKTSEAIDAETRKIMDHSFDSAIATIRHYRDFVEQGVALLLEKETLDEDSLKALWTKTAPLCAMPNLHSWLEKEGKPVGGIESRG